MIAHGRFRDWVPGFTRQWLGMDGLDLFMFKQKLFPAFFGASKEAAREKVYSTVQRLARDNLSLRRLLLSDEFVVHGLLPYEQRRTRPHPPRPVSKRARSSDVGT